MAAPARYAFDVEWLDPSSKVVWQYQLLFTPADGCVEIYDPKARKMFLKKTPMPALKLDQLFVGASVVILARTLKITAYADDFTRSQLAAQRESAFALVKAEAVQHAGAVLDALTRDGFVLSNCKLAHLTPAQGQALLAGQPDAGEALHSLVAGPCLGMELVGKPGAVGRVQALLGAADPAGLRSRCGGAPPAALLHASASVQSAAAAIALFFSSEVASAARGSDTTLAIVKPHAVAAGAAGALLHELQSRFEVMGAALVSVDRTDAIAFLEVYKGVVPEYGHLVEELTAGPALAVELAARADAPPTRDSVVQQLRDLAGPADPELGRVLRPQSLRARFGTDKVKNALHVTDLESDGELEVAFFFRAQR